jgi:hypothetical protein
MPSLPLVFEKKSLIPETFEPLTECCHTFDRQQHKAFLAFLDTPYFNNDPFMSTLYQHIINAGKRKSKSVRAKRLLGEWELASNIKMTVSELKKKVKNLYSLVLQFIAQDYLNQEETERLRILQKALSNKGAPLALGQVVENCKQQLGNTKTGIQKLQNQFFLFYDAYFELDTKYEKEGLQLIVELEQYRQRISDLLEAMLSCEKTNLLAASTEQDNYSESAKIEPLDVDLIKLFQMARSLHLSPEGFSQQALDEFSDFFLSVHDQLEENTRLLLCKSILNVLSIAVSLGQDQLKYQLWEWIKRKVEWSIQPVRNVPANSFVNVVLTACGCGDFSYAIWYIQEYGSKTTDEAKYLADAYYDFFKGDFEKTIKGLEQHFPRFSVSQLSYTLRTKTLLLRACLANEIMYSKGFEKFLAIKDDFRVFIKRKEVKLPQKQYLAYTNFLSLATEILNADERSHDFESPQAHQEFLEQLSTKINTTQPLLCKGWLLEMAGLLKGVEY